MDFSVYKNLSFLSSNGSIYSTKIILFSSKSKFAFLLRASISLRISKVGKKGFLLVTEN